jgi:hypothetical protein
VNPTPPADEVEGIARDLERYVSLHPTAADTPDGIARWWLARSEKPALNLVEAALELLVGRGLLVRKPLPDGNFIYGGAQRPAPGRTPPN